MNIQASASHLDYTEPMQTYTVLLFQDPDEPTFWLGCVPAVPAAMSQGDSFEHALEMTQEALELVLEHDLQQGLTLPTDSMNLEQAMIETRERFELPSETTLHQARLSVGVSVQTREVSVAA
jgi:predicted RNase H-like HicB family nuclease